MSRSFFFCLLFAHHLQAQQSSYALERLHERINTAQYDEISPVISVDGQTLYFTRVGAPDFERSIWSDSVDLAKTLSPDMYDFELQRIYSDIASTTVFNPVRSDFNQDIWIAKSLLNGDFSSLEHPTAPLNNALPNSLCSLTPDPNVFVVVNQFPKDGGMMKGFSLIRRSDSTWEAPEVMDIDRYDIVSAGISLTMSGDGEVLILSLPAFDSYGDNDLYICRRVGKENHWAAPQNMGRIINSSDREVTPHLSADGRELYFASNRLGVNSLGGLDLFYCTRLDTSWTNWTTPRPFIRPINSEYDDSQPYFNPTTGYLYFSSKRQGTSDIYRVKIAPAETPTLNLKISVVNSMTLDTLDARVQYGTADSNNFERYAQTIDGYSIVSVQKGQTLRFLPFVPGFIAQEVEKNFDANTYFATTQHLTLYVDPVVSGANISLPPIYFERTKATLLSSSYQVLDKLVNTLRKFPQIERVSIEGHTDNQGERASLQKLSEARAATVRQFLIERGIAPKRVESCGFGSNRPLSTNASEQTRQLNRRVEVKITKVRQ
jgi:outer membrane protein OmpA-like peptidoglycan-associated protein